ncbi:MAG TPA: C40 family peptidase [Acidimicrobiales bacterium]|nr:C40 family peptidase [Acidimicrobiales bacterium]
MSSDCEPVPVAGGGHAGRRGRIWRCVTLGGLVAAAMASAAGASLSAPGQPVAHRGHGSASRTFAASAWRGLGERALSEAPASAVTTPQAATEPGPSLVPDVASVVPIDPCAAPSQGGGATLASAATPAVGNGAAVTATLSDLSVGPGTGGGLPPILSPPSSKGSGTATATTSTTTTSTTTTTTTLPAPGGAQGAAAWPGSAKAPAGPTAPGANAGTTAAGATTTTTAPPAPAPAPASQGAISTGIGCNLVGNWTFGRLAAGETPTEAAAVVDVMKLLGIPYLWGGESHGGFDCSGLVQFVYRQAGVSLPRVAQDQYDAGPAVLPGMVVEPGDLVFFGQSPAGVKHVGMYVGDGLMVDAPETGAVVRFDRVEGFGPIVGVTAPGQR